MVPKNATLLLVGDIDAGAEAAAAAHLGSGRLNCAYDRTESPEAPRPSPSDHRGQARFAAVHDPYRRHRTGEAYPRLPRPRGRQHPLGGSFTSRLNQNLREAHGYTYGARSGFDYRRTFGHFVAGADVATAVTGPALNEFMKELQRIRVPAARVEVERARSYLALGLPAEFETTHQIASKLAELSLFGLPEDEFAQLVPKALAVGPTELRRAASAYIDPASVVIVIVGDRATIEGPSGGSPG